MSIMSKLLHVMGTGRKPWTDPRDTYSPPTNACSVPNHPAITHSSKRIGTSWTAQLTVHVNELIREGNSPMGCWAVYSWDWHIYSIFYKDGMRICTCVQPGGYMLMMSELLYVVDSSHEPWILDAKDYLTKLILQQNLTTTSATNQIFQTWRMRGKCRSLSWKHSCIMAMYYYCQWDIRVFKVVRRSFNWIWCKIKRYYNYHYHHQYQNYHLSFKYGLMIHSNYGIGNNCQGKIPHEVNQGWLLGHVHCVQNVCIARHTCDLFLNLHQTRLLYKAQAT